MIGSSRGLGIIGRAVDRVIARDDFWAVFLVGSAVWDTAVVLVARDNPWTDLRSALVPLLAISLAVQFAVAARRVRREQQQDEVERRYREGWRAALEHRDDDALACYARALAAARRLHDRRSELQCLERLSALRQTLGQFREADAVLVEGIALASAVGDWQFEVMQRLRRADTLTALGRLNDAETELGGASERLAGKPDAAPWCAWALESRGDIAERQEDFAGAHACYHEAFDTARRAGNQGQLALLSLSLARGLRRAGDREAAAAALDDAEARCGAWPDVEAPTVLLIGVAREAIAQSQFDRSAALLLEIIASLAGWHRPRWIAQATALRSFTELHRGNLDRAVELAEAGLELVQAAPSTRGLASPVADFAQVLGAAGQTARALNLLSGVLAAQRTDGDPSATATLTGIGYTNLVGGDSAAAASAFRECLGLMRDHADWSGVDLCLAGLAEVALRQGDKRRALVLFAAAAAARDRYRPPALPLLQARRAATEDELAAAVPLAVREPLRAAGADMSSAEAAAFAIERQPQRRGESGSREDEPC